MTADSETFVAPLIAQLVRDNAVHLQEHQKDMRHFLENWIAKQEMLVKRFEAHDTCLEHFVANLPSLRFSSNCEDALHRTFRGSPGKHIPLASVMSVDDEFAPRPSKVLREESTHAASQDQGKDVPRTVGHSTEASPTDHARNLIPGSPGRPRFPSFSTSGAPQEQQEHRASFALPSIGFAPMRSWASFRRKATGSESSSDVGSEQDRSTNSCQQRKKSGHQRFSVNRVSSCDEYGVEDSYYLNAPADEKRQKLQRVATQLALMNKPQHSCFASCVLSWPFQGVCAAVILFHMSVIFAETQYEATTLRGHARFDDINLGLNLWYGMEVVIKISALRRKYFTGSDRKWNILDVFLVLVSLLDFGLTFLGGSVASEHDAENLKMTKSVRIMRLARLVRLFRIFRFLTFAYEFQKMVLSMLNCLATLFWSMIVLAFVTWCFGIMLTQIITTAWKDESETAPSDSVIALRDMFAHVPSGMFFLFQAVTGGLNWGQISELLFDVDTLGAALFVTYISFTFFGVLNIVTSVFVESALQATQHHRELLIKDRMRVKATYANHVKTIFECIDADGSGMISIDEVEHLFHDDHLREFIEALEVNATDARMLFRLLDYDASGSISADEFVDGCLKLKGEAKSFDVYCLIYENERNVKLSNRFMKTTQGTLESLASKMVDVTGLLNKMHAVSNDLRKSVKCLRPASDLARHVSYDGPQEQFMLEQYAGDPTDEDSLGRLPEFRTLGRLRCNV